MIEPDVVLGLSPDLGFAFSALDVEIIDFDMAGSGLIFSSLLFEALANVDEFDTRVALPLDFGDVGAVVPRLPEAIDRAEDEAKGRPLDAEDDPRPRLEVTLVVFAEFDIFCVRQTEK